MRRMEAIVVLLLMSFSVQADDRLEQLRQRLVQNEIVAAGVKDQRVIDVMRKTPRHEFVPEAVRGLAYRDMALPIGFGQTISSPYIVARMTEQIEPKPSDRILEVGTGSGYQAAILSPLVKEVYSIEIVPGLGQQAMKTLARLGYRNVETRIGDGYRGWEEHAPFDKIIVTCSPEDIPQPLVDQLAEGGHLVIPVGERFQQALCRFTKTDGKLVRQRIEATYFVPMTGKAESERKTKGQDGKPTIVNGSFEDRDFEGSPDGWYYIRNGRVLQDPKSPAGTKHLEITRPVGESGRAIQPVGVDGSLVRKLAVQFWSKGQGVQTEVIAIQNSQLMIEFYDENRKLCGDFHVRVRKGTFDWQRQSATVEVPDNARLAMIQLGLFGATGKIAFDDLRVTTDQVPPRQPVSPSARQP